MIESRLDIARLKTLLSQLLMVLNCLDRVLEYRNKCYCKLLEYCCFEQHFQSIPESITIIIKRNHRNKKNATTKTGTNQPYHFNSSSQIYNYYNNPPKAKQNASGTIKRDSKRYNQHRRKF